MLSQCAAGACAWWRVVTTKTLPPCPCGSGQAYGACCGPCVDGTKQPATADALMRSRYTAYVHAQEEYLLRTWHPSTRPPALNLAEGARVKWFGLEVVRTEAGGVSDAEGIVEFVARYKQQGRASRLHEVSRFVRENGQWFYVEGVLNDRRSR